MPTPSAQICAGPRTLSRLSEPAFSEAVETAKNALALANAQGNTVVATELQEQLSLYKAGKPFRETQKAAP